MPFNHLILTCVLRAQVRRSHEDDRGGSADDAEAQGDEKKGMHWTIWALTKLAAITLVCGFIAGAAGIPKAGPQCACFTC